MNKYNWDEIQKFYDEGHTWREIVKFFGICIASINRAKKRGDFISRNISTANILSHKRFPRKLTQDTKNKISIGRISYLKEHPDQVPYLLNHYSKGESYPEKYFNEILVNSNIEFERYLQYGIYNLDFAVLDKLIDIEIDGDQHILDRKIIESNMRRDKFLEKNGWKVIRILWSKYLKLNDDGRKEIISELINRINNDTIKKNDIEISMINNKQKRIMKKYFCSCGKKISRQSKTCVSCREILNRKVERPTKEEIRNLLQNKISWTKMGKMFGVSDNAVRKWAKAYEIIS